MVIIPFILKEKAQNITNSTILKTIFEPIFEKYNVDAYICEHKYDLKLIQEPNKQIVEFASGTKAG